MHVHVFVVYRSFAHSVILLLHEVLTRSLMQSLVWFSKKKIEEIVLKILPIASDFVLLYGEIFPPTKGSVIAGKYAE